MTVLNIICYLAFAARLIALPVLLVNCVRYIKSRPMNNLVAVRTGFPIKSVSFFVASALTTVVAANIMTTHARHDAVNFIQSLSGNYVVYIDGSQVDNPDR